MLRRRVYSGNPFVPVCPCACLSRDVRCEGILLPQDRKRKQKDHSMTVKKARALIETPQLLALNGNGEKDLASSMGGSVSTESVLFPLLRLGCAWRWLWSGPRSGSIDILPKQVGA